MPRAGGELGLEYLSVFGMPLPDYVALAADLGCDFVSVNYGGAANAPDRLSGESLRASTAQRRGLADALAAHGMRLGLVEGFTIAPGRSVADHADELDAVARLAARSICAVSLEKDPGRSNAELAVLAELCAERGLLLTTEVGAGVMRNFQVAATAWHNVAQPNFALLVDAMHFFRRGGTPGDLRSVPESAIGHLQLCDVPMRAPFDSYMEEALFERRAPGDGDLPLAELLAGVPATVPVGLEVPIRSRRDAGEHIAAVLRDCISKARQLIGIARSETPARGR